MGFSSATKTYVSTLIAEKRQADLIPTIKKLMIMIVALVRPKLLNQTNKSY
jgi:hypothetical protein